MLPGLHRIRRNKGARVYEYWYAWRGGPQILSAAGSNERALQLAVAKAAPDAIARFNEAATPRADELTLYGLITRYLHAMAENANLADRTKKDRRAHLDVARAELGEMELRALESRKTRPFLLSWRDRRCATPKTADDLLGDLSTVFNWAVDRGEIPRNPVADFPRIYKVNRAEVIWEEQHLQLIVQHADPEAAWAIKLAASTGLRKGDLIKLPWTAVRPNAIVWQTGKSRGRKTVVIPMTPQVRAALAEIPRKGVTVLTSSDGRPWKAPGAGLDSAVRRARLGALAHMRKVHGPKATSGLEGRRFHDLRGTAATYFLLNGLDEDQVADLFSWDIERVHELAKRYVSADAIAAGMLARIEFRNRSETKTVKPGVKPARRTGA